ncbi:MAG: S-layer homology domain-containing protein [Candidatus Altimarinota bacterium]
MKKTLILLTGIQIFLIGLPFVNAQEFTDVDGYAWENSINYLRENEVVGGYDDGSFKPEKLINRAEFTKIIMGARFADEVNSSQNKNCFPDVASGQWFTQYVCLAKEKGIIGGYPDGTFKPEQTIQQAEALKILLLAFDQPVEVAAGEWYQQYLNAAKNSGMNYFVVNNAGGYKITRGEMAYFTAWLSEKFVGENPVDQLGEIATGTFTSEIIGTTHVVKMPVENLKMKVLSGNDSLRPKDLSKCDFGSDCVAEAQAESFDSFVNRSHKGLLVNGAFFDSYSASLNGGNFHQISSDIVIGGLMRSMYGYQNAFGDGGMLAQKKDGSFEFYYPIRNWVEDKDEINFAISNYPLVLRDGAIRTKEEIGSHADNDSKFWISARRGGLGISADGGTVYYVSAVGTVEDLGRAMLENGVWNGFALDSGASNAFSLNGKTTFVAGRSLTTVVEFYKE